MHQTKIEYTVIYEPAEEGGYIARIPFLDDLTTQGETLEEARAMAKDAIECYLGGLLKEGLSLPREKKKYKPTVEKIQTLVTVP